ncbi:hypothetical protein [Niveispirillum fermenti]|uniref:hypothetical protein n=1 Tax=Niveispirillum fermenti TaxID=1233113 RepID=UPI003A8B4928
MRADGLTFTTNAGDGSNTGLEVSPRLHLGPWRLEATLTLSDPELTKLHPGFPAVPEGGLPGAAHISGGASLSWRGPLIDGVDLLAALDYSHAGRTHLTFTKGISQGPVDLLNGRLVFDIADSLSVGLSVGNMLDTAANQFAYGNPFTLSGGPQTTPPRPRTVRLSFGWSG